jgi:Leucine-rich repeat (LRR) protein
MTDASGLHLSLWKQALGVVPDEVWDRKDLQTLVLADNDPADVSERIGELRDLRELDLGHNRLRRVPDSIGDIESLTDFLFLHDNELTELPLSLMRLDRLRYLNISENAFEVLPEAVTGMFGLIELRVFSQRRAGLSDSRQA